MNGDVRSIRHSDSVWHDRFFRFIELTFGGVRQEAGRE
jgi:hypothetical protein